MSTANEPTKGDSHTMSKNKPVRIENVSKSFGSVQALEDVSFSVEENEVLALMGDNGAGKSTLIKILSGVLQSTSGHIYINDEEAVYDDYTGARAAGIETVYQTLAVAPHRSVMDNIFLGKEPLVENTIGKALSMVDDERMRRETIAVLDQLDMDLDPDMETGNLSGGQQQAVAIGRALQSEPAILIMDEPTSALSVEASQQILDLINRLQNRGLTIILVDHNIDEVFEVADRAAVLTSGQSIGTRPVESLTERQLIQMMMGTTET
jgi:ABC-type sugar transport system ATPase subunit